jgi:predicted transcriptional regulator
MAQINDLEFTGPDSILDEEDEATLAAIDEGIKAADEGHVASTEEVRKLVPQWISKFHERSMEIHGN